MGMYAYEDPVQCSSVPPDLDNGKFIKRYDYDGVYQCPHSSDLLYVVDEKAKCITFEECFYSAIKGIRARGWCLSREEWVAKDPAHNYVGINLNVTILETEVSDEITAAEICKNVNGAILLGGHVCTCPEGQYPDPYWYSDE